MKSIPTLIVYTGLMSLPSQAAILPALNPSTAIYDSNVKGIVSDGDKGPGMTGHLSGIPALNTAEHAAGFTFNVDITPGTADLTGTVLLISLGGTSNGAGLYLVDGVPTMVTKHGSVEWAKPTALHDTTLIEVSVQSTLGTLTAGTRYSFSASWNHAGVLELKTKPDAGSAVTDTFTITGTPGNWSGADTLHVGTVVSRGYLGGLAGSVANVGAPFDVDLTQSFAGTIHRALLWNSSAITTATTLHVVSSQVVGSNLVVNFAGAPSTTYQVRGSTDLTSFTIDHGTAATDAGGAGVATVPIVGTTGFVRIEE